MATPPTQAVLLTPHGRGAIATLLVAGPMAGQVVGRLFRAADGRPLEAQPCGRIVYGRWQSRAGGEELVVSRCAADRVEIHCHGGQVAAAAILAALAEEGCQAIDWRQWVASEEPDPIAAQARIALAGATTERAAAVLSDQAAGALSRALAELRASLAASDAASALGLVESLLEFAPLGLRLIEAWKVVLAGRPNVGKSSLMNALLGYTRAIVHDTPGTTRDIVTAATAFGGWAAELTDTAGLHDSSDPLESEGIRRAGARLAAADLVVLVHDASSAWSGADAALVERWSTGLVVHNKSDLVATSRETTDRPSGMCTSARSGQGIGELERAIAERLVPRAPKPVQPVPFMAEQGDALREIRGLVQAGRLAEAVERLAEPDLAAREPR